MTLMIIMRHPPGGAMCTQKIFLVKKILPLLRKIIYN